MRIKVIREDGIPLDYGTALIRNILRIVDALPILYILGAILITVTNRKQRLGDIVAKNPSHTGLAVLDLSKYYKNSILKQKKEEIQ